MFRKLGIALAAFGLAGPALAQGQPPAANPVVGIFEGGLQCLMGGSQEGRYLDGDKAAGLVRGGTRYTLFDLGGRVAEATGSLPIPGGEPCTWLHQVELTPAPSESRRAVALAAGWPALPATLRVASTEQPVYREAIALWLHAAGLTDKAPVLTQVVRTDLEGDGVEEVVINATRQAEYGTSGRAGTYSAILLRRLRNGVVETVPVVSQLFPVEEPQSLPFRFAIVAILDLNGDGRAEIVVSADYYEGGSLEAYEIAPDGVAMVLECGCGV